MVPFPSSSALAGTDPRPYQQVLFEHNAAGAMVESADGSLVAVNEALVRMLGYASRDELSARPAEKLYSSTTTREELLARLRDEDPLTHQVYRLRRKDGTSTWVMSTLSRVAWNGAGRAILATAVELPPERRFESKIEEIAHRDFLTGLANRLHFQTEGERALAVASRYGDNVGVVYVDVTRFKRINDALGHAGGDRVLVEVAHRLRAASRETDLVGRLGGDEFAVLLPGIGGERALRAAAERLAAVFERPVTIDGRSVHMRVQLGAALYPDHANDWRRLLLVVGTAARGGEIVDADDVRVRMYDPDASEVRPDVLAEETALREGIRSGLLTVHYQPIYRVTDGSIGGVEALARWNHPQRGLLTAGQFVPLAEEAGLIRELDRWILETALTQLGRWERGGDRPWVSVNLSPTTLRDPDIVDAIAETLEAAGVSPDRLVIEITEQSAMANYDAVGEALRKLRGLGVRIALDDFGTGHSSLAYLDLFPADLLKLDHLFIRDLEASPRNERVARAVIDLGRAVGMEVIVEGVERETQLDWVRSDPCEYVQGYLTGRPVPPDELSFSVAKSVA